MFGRPGTPVGSEVNEAFRTCIGEEVKASRC